MKDLFEHYDLLPPDVLEVITPIQDGGSYSELQSTLKQVQALGYTFDYGLDAVPFDLHKIA